jgi:tRNA (guanine6-N2)-methyltransferase
MDLDSPVRDRILLVSLPGALDYLVAELGERASADEFAYDVVRRFSDALLIDYRGPIRPLAAVRFYSAAAVWLGAGSQLSDEDAVTATLGRTRADGVVSLLETAGDITFRVAPDLDEARWLVRDALTSRLGWINAPRQWQLNLRVSHSAVVAEVGSLYQTARFGEMRRRPASTTPVVSAVLVRLLKPSSGDVVLDPFCGAATNLVVAAAMTPGLRLVGLDSSWAALDAARHNVASLPCAVVRADAGSLPLPDSSVDRVVANLPFGKRVGSHATNVDLYPKFLRGLSRVLAPGGRAVLLTEDKRLFTESVQRTANLKIIKEIELATGGLHPSAYVVVHGRSGRRPAGAKAGRRRARG